MRLLQSPRAAEPRERKLVIGPPATLGLNSCADEFFAFAANANRCSATYLGDNGRKKGINREKRCAPTPQRCLLAQTVI